MSSRRIVTRALIAFVVVLAAGWFGASAFPLEARPQTRDAAVSHAAAPGQNPPRDRRPGEAGLPSAQEIELQKAIQSDSSRRDLYFQLARLQEERGALDEAESTWNALRQAFPNDRTALMMVAGAHNRSGRFEQAVQALEEAAALDPTNPEGHQIIATFYWEKAFKDKSLSAAETQSYIKAGISATDKALSYNPDYVDALTYKNILLRMQANLEPDRATRQAFLAEADTLRGRAIELNKARLGAGTPGRVQMESSAPPPPPPPPPAPDAQRELVDGLAPIRLGGNMRPPVKVHDVRPVYPAEAREAKVQGVVIIEATIDTLGNVVRTRVLRAVPTFERAALEAVEQWKFQPTLMNGVPVPVIMTVTVNFTLQ
jgi:TonB family protein